MFKNYDLSEIDTIAAEILEAAKHKTIVFYGEMGLGKTTLIKSITKQLGITEIAHSPTFSLVNEYATGENTIYHFDCYRIENEEDAFDIGIEEYLYANAWCFIEWPERIAGLLPEEITEIHLKKINTKTRSLHLKNVTLNRKIEQKT